MSGEPQDRFFIDHGTIHDRKTGRHVGDKDDRLEECCAELNALARERNEARATIVRERVSRYPFELHKDTQRKLATAVEALEWYARLTDDGDGIRAQRALAAIRGTEGK